MLDIHSHILPGVDDGAQTIEDSLEILSAMQRQGVTDVIATPHFYPHRDNLEDFLERTSKAYQKLKAIAQQENLPNIYLGCEILYYSGISKVPPLESFTLNGSKYLLLELTPYLLSKTLLSEILYLINERGITPIIAHVERYYKSKDYKYLLKFIRDNDILTQINATSFFSKKYEKTLDLLINEDLVTFIATDAHSMDTRPPLIRKALRIIENEYGQEVKQKLIQNAENLFSEITQEDSHDEI